MPAPMPELEGVAHRWVDAAGIRFHVAEAGEGDPVVLLHGWPQHWWAWRLVIPRLVAAGHRVLAPDLRGFGWSDATPSTGRKDELGSDVIALLDALGLDRVTLAGHDWGGMAGFFACLAAPERIRGYLAMSIVHPWSSLPLTPQAVGGAAYQLVLGTPGLGALLHRRTPVVPTMLRLGGRRPSAAEGEAFAAPFRDPAHAAAASRVYRAFVLHERGEIHGGAHRERRLPMPVRLVVGTGDPVITRAVAGGLEDHADDASIEWVEGRHWLPEEQPELVADRILRLAGGVRDEG